MCVARAAATTLQSSLTLRTVNFLNINIPRAVNTTLDALISRTLVRVACQRSINLLPTTPWNLESVVQPNLCDLQDTIHFFDVTFDIGH
jgi:hypothetical protein